MLRVALALTLSCMALPACASDAAPEPEAELQTSGAFVAVKEQGGGFSLYRTLDTLTFSFDTERSDTALFLTTYDVAPKSWSEAREISKDRDIPILQEVVTVFTSQFPATPYRVVWFRTLTEEEKQRLE